MQRVPEHGRIDAYIDAHARISLLSWAMQQVLVNVRARSVTRCNGVLPIGAAILGRDPQHPHGGTPTPMDKVSSRHTHRGQEGSPDTLLTGVLATVLTGR